MALSELLFALKDFFLSHVLKMVLKVFSSLITKNMSWQYKRLFQIDRIQRRVENSEFQIRLHIVYNSDADFSLFCNELKNCLRKKYRYLEILKENLYMLQLAAGDLFNIKVHKTDNQIVFETSKLTLQTKNATQKTHQLLNCLDDVQEKIKNKDDDIKFEVSGFSLYLYLPVNNSFSKVYTPDILNIDNYKIKAVHSEENNVIEIQAEQICITTPYRHKLDEIIEFFV